MANSVKNGIYVSRPGTEPDGVPILRISAVRPMQLSTSDLRYTGMSLDEVEAKDGIAKPGDLLFTRYNGNIKLVGACARVPDHAPVVAYPDKLIRVALPAEVDSRFLCYAWAWAETQTQLRQHVKTTAGQAGISGSSLKSIRLPLAPLAEQHRIVEALEDHLSRLDAASISLAHVQALIPLQRRSLYTTATEGRLNTGTADVVPDFLKQRREFWESTQVKKYKEPAAPNLDHTPQSPDSWTVYSLEALTDPVRLIRYGILMPKVKHDGTVPYVEVKDLKGCSLHEKKLHLTSKDLDEQFAGARIQPGDVLLAVRGSYDRSAVVPSGLKGANVSRDVARLAPLPGIDPEYLQLYLQSSFTQRYLKAHARGVAVKGVNIGSIRALPVAVPPIATQKQIVEEVQQQTTAIAAAARAVKLSSARSAVLRGALLNRAFTGRLVPQNTSDEPTSSALDRMRAEREAQGGKAKRGTRRPRKAAEAAPPPAPASTPSPATAVQQELPL